MEDKITLPRSVSGTELMELLRKTASELGWRCNKYVDNYSVSPGSAKVTPVEYRLDILIGRILRKSVWTGVAPNQTYDSITLYGDRIGPKKLEMFASTLYDLLGQ